MIPGNINTDLISGDEGAYQVERSLRFNSSDSAYLSRTPSSAGNRKTWTLSFWVKRGTGNLNGTERLGQAGTSISNVLWFGFTTNGVFQLQDYPGSSAANLITNASFRDTSAWYHWVISVDTTQATPANRIKIYVNSAEQTFSTASYPTQNADLLWNAAHQHDLGCRSFIDSNLFNGYLANVEFVDGSALTPASFGETNATTGQWVPKAYTGSYGTNGFKLSFSNNASTTTISQDSSGNNNHWTANNISVTAGAGNDSLVDTPTSYGTDTGAGGEVRGNYATLNPLSSTVTPSDGNLQASIQASADVARCTIGISSASYYAEFLVASSGSGHNVGVVTNSSGPISGDYWLYHSNGRIYYSGGATGIIDPPVNGDIIGIAVNATSGSITFYKNSTLIYTFSGLSNSIYYFALNGNNGTLASIVANFGQRPFAYTAPSGFKALCDTNLTAGTITTSGSFTGNANADGPFIWLNGVPTAMTINGNSVTFGTHADKLANGFKLRTSSTSYNLSGTNNFSVTTTGDKFKFARAQTNP